MMDKKFKKDIEAELKETTDLAKLQELEGHVDASLADMKSVREQKNKEAEEAAQKRLAEIYADLTELFKYSSVLPTDIEIGPEAERDGDVYGFVAGSCAGEYDLIEMLPCVSEECDLRSNRCFIEIRDPSIDIRYRYEYTEIRRSETVREIEPLLVNWEDTFEAVKRGTADLMKRRIAEKIKNAETEEKLTDEAWDRFCKTKSSETKEEGKYDQ